MTITDSNTATRLTVWRKLAFSGLTVLVMALAGCTTVGVQEQRLVSKPNMTVSDNAIFNYQSRLFQQTEPGAADTGGAASAGCSSCR